MRSERIYFLDVNGAAWRVGVPENSLNFGVNVPSLLLLGLLVTPLWVDRLSR